MTIVKKASEYFEPAQEFYKSCDRKVELKPEDDLVIVFVGSELAGIVRLCFENGEFVLRSMQISPQFQRQGLGTILLERFEDLLNERKIQKIFCMPYLHLEKFYGQIGFRRIETEASPDFLQDRVIQFYESRKSDRDVILMAREV